MISVIHLHWHLAKLAIFDIFMKLCLVIIDPILKASKIVLVHITDKYNSYATACYGVKCAISWFLDSAAAVRTM